MISNNKILTVSYGTFSCTLEGFDDSFGTMKAIAEYFRDLAADDRYFGAEPPQPDAQMLARIAQRQISRHVDAREDEGRIVLSARGADAGAAALLDGGAADQVTPKDVARDVVEDVADAVAEAASEQMSAPEPVEAPEQAKPDSAQAEEMTPGDEDEAADAESSGAVTADADAAEAEAAEAEMPGADVPDIVPSLPDAEVEAFFAEASYPRLADVSDTEDDLAEDVAPAPAAERAKVDSIAEKLKRIRAVVSQQVEAEPATDYVEDEPLAEEIPAPISAVAPNAALADTLRDLEDALDADDETYGDDASDTAADAPSEDDDVAAILNRLDREAEDGSFADMEFEFVADESGEDEQDEDVSAADSIGAIDDMQDNFEEEELYAEENLFEPETPEQPEYEADPDADADATAAPRTRVLKVKRATLQAAIDAGQLEEYDDEAEEDDTTPAAEQPLRKAPLARTSTLSEEAEEELARELADLEADMARGDAEPETAEADEEPAQASDDLKVPDAAYEDADEDGDAVEAGDSTMRAAADVDLSRLMEETDNQMGEPESATRRDAFAHLRAAVAAKKADEAVGGTTPEHESDEPYRDDLANVVRPRRPASGEGRRTERPAEQRPAPLKLVAEQRIDVARDASAQPVRPRRVAALVTSPEPEKAMPDAESFSDFAANMGATDLPDLLEAAAAYLSFVEGHEQFSRPQLMTKVRQVQEDDFTREDSLRSFGKLLRDGKIEKLSGGRFQASEQIGFKPGARAAG